MNLLPKEFVVSKLGNVNNEDGSSIFSVSREYKIQSTHSGDFENADEKETLEDMPPSFDDRLIVSGLVLKGCFHINESIFVGPDREGNFTGAKILSIRNIKNEDLLLANSDLSVSMCLQFLNCNDAGSFIHRGGFVCTNPNSLELYFCDAIVLNIIEPVNFRLGEEVTLFTGANSAPAKVLGFSNKTITLQFVYKRDYITKSQVILKRGNSIIVGVVQSLILN